MLIREINFGSMGCINEEKKDIKTVSLTKDPLKSLGGFTVLPDYDIQ